MQTERRNIKRKHILDNSYKMNSKWFVFLITSVLIVCECKYGYVAWPDTKLIVKTTDYFADIPDKHVARATYSNEINSTGWAFLELHTSADYSDEKQAYGAGYLEGYLTRDLIWYHWQNMLKGYCYNKTDVCGLIEEFVDKNEKYMSTMVNNYPRDPYWYQLKLYYTQLKGLAVGYNDATTDPYQWLSSRDIIYQSMLRFHKMYVMNLHLLPGSKELIPGYKMSLSSYPAFIQSTDDFYIISSGLATSETTIGNSNRSLFELITPVGTVLEYARAMIANRLARDGKEWVDLYSKHNSGTYNNQWFIVDYNKFRPHTPRTPGLVLPGLLWVVEQIPGFTDSADLTELLIEQTYFPSYNIPYFPKIFNLSGGNVRIATFGDWFGYDTNPRAKIMKQKQEHVHNLRDMYNMMRYNDYKHDPLSRCEQCQPPYSACNAIAARNDLNPANGSFPFRALGHRSHGGTDVKITSAYLRSGYRFLAICSPTYNISRGIPPFKWSDFDLGTHICHIGQPDEWMFSPLVHDWEWG